MSFGFSAACARALVTIGLVAITAGILLGVGVAVVPADWFANKIGTVDRIIVIAGLVFGGLVFGGPLVVVGQLMLALLNVRENVERLSQHAGGEDDVPCPHCAEDVKPEAILCPHCRSDLRRPTAADRFFTPR
jgi:hypothetical protein